MMKISDLDNETRIDLWCVGALNGLVEIGMMPIGTCDKLNSQGIGLFDQIDAEFKPSDTDIRNFLENANITSHNISGSGTIDIVYTVLLDFRDRREEMKEGLA